MKNKCTSVLSFNLHIQSLQIFELTKWRQTSPDWEQCNDLLHIVAIYVADVMFLIGPGGYRVGDCTKWDNATRGSTREKHGGGIRPICITGDSRKSFIQTQGKNWAQVGGKGLLGRGQLISISLVKLWW